MDVEIAVWLVLLVVVLLFASDRVPPDAVALGGLLALVAVGALDTREALAGFSSPAVIAIGSLLVLSAALERSGVVRRIADGLQRIVGAGSGRLLLAGTVAPGLLSGVINIIATVSVFIPVLLRIALKTRRPPGQLLLPMAYVAMAGASLTLIGASHNLVVNDILQSRKGSGFGFFEFTPVGLVMVTVSTLYALLCARWLLPARETPEDDSAEEQTHALIRRYAFHERVWEVEVQHDAAAVGRRIDELRLAEDFGLSLISLVRADRSRPHLQPDSSLQGGDILLMGGRRERVEALTAQVEGLELRGAPAQRDDFSTGSAELIEVLVPPRSPAIGCTVREPDLRQRADLTAIALWRDDGPLRTDAETTVLRAGDAILLYGNKRYTRGFEPEPEFRWLHPPQKAPASLRAQRRAPWTVLIFLLVIVGAALDWFPIAVTALAGALTVTLIGALEAKHAYGGVDWRTLVLIAAMLPFATALNSSGASAHMARWLTENPGQWGPLAVLAAVAAATLLLTQALHNAAAAAVMTPVALDAAQQLQVNPTTFAIAVLVSASMSVLLPMGHPAVLLVRPGGNYRARDYLRFGSGLALLTLAVVVLVVPRLWPLAAQ